MRRYTLEVNGKQYVIDVEELAADQFRVHVDNRIVEVRLESDEDLAQAVITPEIATGPLPTRAPTSPGHYTQAAGAAAGGAPPTGVRSTVSAAPRPVGGQGSATLNAPMPGVVLAVEVAPGATVTRGQVLIVLEAMKMKNSIKSPRDGVVAEVFARPDQPVGHGDALLRFAEGTDDH